MIYLNNNEDICFGRRDDISIYVNDAAQSGIVMFGDGGLDGHCNRQDTYTGKGLQGQTVVFDSDQGIRESTPEIQYGFQQVVKALLEFYTN